MADRVQISCEKQGRNDTGSWSTRVLTIDPLTTTLTVSRHHHPNNLFYHSIQLTEVVHWPNFSASITSDDFQSLHAKRTLLVIGVEVPVPLFALDLPETHSDDTPLPGQHSVDSTSDASSSNTTPAQYAFMAGDATKRSRPIETGGYDSWVLRFNTQESYDTAMQVMHTFAGVHFDRKHGAEVVAAMAMMPLPLVAAPIGPM